MDAAEWEEKERRLQAFCREQHLDGVWLTRAANVAWLSGGGRTYINIATEGGVGSLLVTPSGRYLLTDVIEAERLRVEEGFGAGGWQIVAEPWYARTPLVEKLAPGLRIGTDQAGTAYADVSAGIARLRWVLTPAEVARFRSLGADAGAAIGEAATAVRPGMTEDAIAGLLADAAYRRGAVPVVVLVATDERIAQRRHPLPTGRPLERTAMLVLCARRGGLVANVTRMVHHGVVPDTLHRALQAAATVDGAVIGATRPGARVDAIFAALVDAYAAAGYPGEWQHHHQGGLAGYEGREYIATPTNTEIVAASQAFAWNPSVPGAKSEDTVLITEAGAEVLTATPGWPQIRVPSGAGTMERPDILQIA